MRSPLRLRSIFILLLELSPSISTNSPCPLILKEEEGFLRLGKEGRGLRLLRLVISLGGRLRENLLGISL